MVQKRNTEQKILNSALSLFVLKGYHGTSINHITQKVGVTKGALYSHFTSKEDLLIRIIDKYETEFIDRLIESVKVLQGNPVDKLYEVFKYAARFARDNQDLCVFLTFMTIELKANMDAQPILKRIYRKYQKFISTIIEEGIKVGVFRKTVDPDLASLSLIALHDGALNQWVLNQNQLDGDFYARTYRELFLNGIIEPDR